MSTRPTSPPGSARSDVDIDAATADGGTAAVDRHGEALDARQAPSAADGSFADGALATPAEPSDPEPVDSPPETPAPAASSTRWRRLLPFVAIAAVLAGIGLGYYIYETGKRVKIDDAIVTAPSTTLTPRGGGTLKQVYASVGDMVRAHRPVARVGNEVITSDFPGTVISIRQDLGASIPAGATVATLINRGDLRAVGLVKEDSGLSDLRIGQRATVKVDAFGGREFRGVVDEISNQPHDQDLSFSISDKREEREYEVKVRFDGGPAPVLEQGMSAKLWVYK